MNEAPKDVDLLCSYNETFRDADLVCSICRETWRTGQDGCVFEHLPVGSPVPKNRYWLLKATVEAQKGRAEREAQLLREKQQEDARKLEENKRLAELAEVAKKWVAAQLIGAIRTATAKGENSIELGSDDVLARVLRSEGFNVDTVRDHMSGWDTYRLRIPS